jgi:hypothetical protein
MLLARYLFVKIKYVHLFLEEKEMQQSLTGFHPLITANENIMTDQHVDETISSVTSSVAVPHDDTMDLLRAIEMSRLQAVREHEQNIYRPHTNINTDVMETSNEKVEYFNHLQQAIELSLVANDVQETTMTSSG